VAVSSDGPVELMTGIIGRNLNTPSYGRRLDVKLRKKRAERRRDIRGPLMVSSWVGAGRECRDVKVKKSTGTVYTRLKQAVVKV